MKGVFPKRDAWLMVGGAPLFVVCGAVLLGVGGHSYLTYKDGEALGDPEEIPMLPDGTVTRSDEIRRLRLYMIVVGALVVLLAVVPAAWWFWSRRRLINRRPAPATGSPTEWQ